MTDRDNGLVAARYAVLGDVEPQAVDLLLDRLRAEGIAAYVEASPGSRGPYGEVVLPSRPTDRLHVDAERLAEARTLVEDHLRTIEEDVAWADIVAGFDLPADTVGRWPASEEVDERERDESANGPEVGFDRLRDAAAPAAAADESPYDPEPFDEGHYVPPPPPPLPRTDTVGRFAWAAALGGPGLLLVAAATGIDLAGWVGVGAVLAFVAGFVTLVARMKDRPPTDSGPDDGAVI